MSLLTDEDIKEAVDSGLLGIDPFDIECLEPASYDLRVGREAYISGTDSKVDVASKGLVILDAGEFAVLTTRETVTCSSQVAGQLGLCSPYANQGLTLLSGPQIDPGFTGVLVVRVTNLSPRRVTLAYEGPFLTTQFFKLSRPVERPYAGSRQGQTGLSARDIEALSSPDSPTFGGMVKSLTALAADMRDLKTSVKWMAWALTLAISVMALAVAGVGIFDAVHN